MQEEHKGKVVLCKGKKQWAVFMRICKKPKGQVCLLPNGTKQNQASPEKNQISFVTYKLNWTGQSRKYEYEYERYQRKIKV